MNPRLRAALLGAALLFTAVMAMPARAGADGDDTPLINVVALASQRLALAVPVAQWKWANNRPITDAPREAALLADVARRAQAAGVDAAYARAFFQDQIDASKQVQGALFAQWRTSAPPPSPAPDLAAGTRPALDRLTQALVAGLARAGSLSSAPDCPVRLARSLQTWKTMTRYDAMQARALPTALAHVCTNGGVAQVG